MKDRHSCKGRDSNACGPIKQKAKRDAQKALPRIGKPKVDREAGTSTRGSSPTGGGGR